MTDAQQPSSDPGGQPSYSPPPATYGSSAPAYDSPSASQPGRTLGIVAFVLSFFLQLVALILGIVALVQSRKAGQKNGFAVAAIIISIVLMVIGTIIALAIVIPLLTFSSEALQACQAVDFTGTVTVRGVTVECSSLTR